MSAKDSSHMLTCWYNHQGAILCYACVQHITCYICNIPLRRQLMTSSAGGSPEDQPRESQLCTAPHLWWDPLCSRNPESSGLVWRLCALQAHEVVCASGTCNILYASQQVSNLMSECFTPQLHFLHALASTCLCVFDCTILALDGATHQ